MMFIKQIFKRKKDCAIGEVIQREVEINLQTIDRFPSFKQQWEKGSIVPDAKGRFRYLHGAPVGNLVLIRVNNDGTPIYKERADEWFDPESLRAKQFVWPEAAEGDCSS